MSDRRCAALIANGAHGGILLDVQPDTVLETDVHEGGRGSHLDEYGLDDAPPGLSMWEGTAIWIPGGYEYPEDGELDYRGEFRPLTADELATFATTGRLWAHVEPEEPEEPEEQCGQCGAIIIAYHACEGPA